MDPSQPWAVAMESIAPAIVSMFLFLAAFGVVVVAMVLKAKGKERLHRERMFLAEKGLEIPKELYEKEEKKEKKPNGFRVLRAILLVTGVLLAFIGVGTALMIWIQEDFRTGAPGLVCILIGLGFLAAEWMLRRKIIDPERRGEQP